MDESEAERQRKYRKYKWATHLNTEDSLKATDLQRFLWNEGILKANSRYAFVAYVIKWAYREMIDKFPNYEEVINKVEEIS